ncbi:MAG TPA: hypothetical protein VGM90_00205 [Kofleriaceae bacterium]|jgi:hypothetical protein
MRRLFALALVVPLTSCAVTEAMITLPQNDSCGLRASAGLIDLGIAAVGAGIVYAEDKTSTGGWIVDGVFVASALLGFARAAACRDRHYNDDNRPKIINPNLNQIPDSVKLEPPPTDPDVRDATPEELGLVPAQDAPKLTVPPKTEPTPPPVPKEQPTPPPEEHAKPLIDPAGPKRVEP